MVLRTSALLLLLWVSLHGATRAAAEVCRGTHCSGAGADAADPRPCAGAHCPGGRSPRPRAPTQRGAAQVVGSQHHAHPRAPSEASAAAQPPRARHGGGGGGGARTRAPEAAPAGGCTAADCPAPAKAFQPTNDTRDCRGIECRLPLTIRPRARTKPCVGDGCVAASEGSVSSAASQLPPVHLSDRAAQFLGDFPELGYPPPELGGAPLGVQLTCDIKPGENEVPSEDALILHLQLAKGQEELVEALRAQQAVIRELQQKLAEQQEALLSQQRQILEQQRRMYEQMDLVKAQYGLLSDTVKQVSFQGLQAELHGYFESHLAGLQNQARSHLQKAHGAQNPEVLDVAGEARFPRPLPGCPAPCASGRFCDFQREAPRCEDCTTCPPGFFPISQCSPTADRMCQDRDECLERPNVCGDRGKCLNTPGGFRCLGLSEREAATGSCGRGYFYNRELQECQACSDCDGQPLAAPCSAASDAVCGRPAEGRLSQSWAAGAAVPSAGAPGRHIFPGLQLNIRGKESSDLLRSEGRQLTFAQHGLVWFDHNFAIRHSCRNFLQVGMRLNGSQEEECRDLGGVRIEQPDGRYFQGVSVSGGAEVEPGHTFALLLKSPNQHCNQSRDLHFYEAAAPSLSLLWLSHDTGAVALSAQMSLAAHHQGSYRPTLRVASVSDPYMLGLTHDGRAVRFTEGGVVKFALQQALYSMGHSCVREGFSLVAYASRNGSAQEVLRAFKAGVNYRDTSVTLSGALSVDGGDTLSFEVTSPSQCNVRYFGDSTGISALSLFWIPSAVSSALTATVSRAGLPFGAVRNKPLFFQQTGPDTPQVHLARSGEPNGRKNFLFRQKGTVNIALSLKLIHSCNIIKLTVQRAGPAGQAGAVAQQVSGSMPEGSEWASIGLRASLQVHNGTALYVTLDCVRGRVNQITHEGGTNVSILWVAV
ncbi:uncharacterized protein nell3 [Betta splendens]|uniref:Uncharacterized protein nell3 n=1 Tax=Betta splendens TaxID=158456 RepID=A0A6P7MFE8_BETSP|nr:uncharacterized protein nell3 [Betta splendens]